MADSCQTPIRHALVLALAAGPALAQEPNAREPATIAGRVVAPDGRPLAGIVIDVLVAGQQQDAAGRFAVAGLPPLATFRVHAAGGGWFCRTPAVWPPPAWLPVPGERFDLGDVVVQRAASIRGRVLRPDGTPCAGATIEAVRDRDRERARPPRTVAFEHALQPLWTPDALFVRSFENGFFVDEPPHLETVAHPERLAARSGEDGTFAVGALRPGAWRVVVQVPGRHLPRTFGVEVTAGARVDLGAVRLHAGRTVQLRVVDAHGAPVPRAEVLIACPHGMRGFGQAGVAATTDDEGWLARDGYPAAHVTLGARRGPTDAWELLERVAVGQLHTLRLAPPPEPDASTGAGAPPGQRDVRRVVAHVRGRVPPPPVDEIVCPWRVVLTPVSDDAAVLRAYEAEAPLAPDGTFQVPLFAEGAYRIAVRRYAWSTEEEWSARAEMDEDLRVTARAGEPAVVDVPVRWRAAAPFAQLRGVLRFNGAPAAGVRVELIPGSSVRTDAHGRFALEVPTAEVDVVIGEGWAQLEEESLADVLVSKRLQLRRGEERALALDLRAGSFVGRVVDARQLPVFGARVEVWCPNEAGDGSAFSAVTDPHGRLRLPVLPAGAYTVHARWGELRCSLPALAIEAERTVLRRLVLRAPLAITGTVDVAALAVPRRDLVLRLWNETEACSLEIGEDGSFAGPVPEGVYDAELDVGGARVAHRVPLRVEPGSPPVFAIVFDASYVPELERARRKR